MKKLSIFITEEKNLHMEHLEDLILNDGVEVAQQIFRFLNATRDMLAGHTKTQVSATVKWDGAPKTINDVRVGIYPYGFVKNRNAIEL